MPFTADGLQYSEGCTCPGCREAAAQAEVEGVPMPDVATRSRASAARRSASPRRMERERTAEAQRRVATRGRRFGVEIEFECGDDYSMLESADIAAALCVAGIDCIDPGYTHAVLRDEWKIVSDSSVEDGWELVSPPLTWEQRGQIAVVCDVLLDMGARAADSCGLHVHHEVCDLTLPQIKRLYRCWHAAQAVTDCLVDERRRGGDWCGRLTDRDLDIMERQVQEVYQLGYFDRYKSLNVSCYENYGTVEVRQHEGTLDAAEILAWIAYGQAFIRAAIEDDGVPFPGDFSAESTAQVDAYLDTLPLECEPSRTYLKRKASRARSYALA